MGGGVVGMSAYLFGFLVGLAVGVVATISPAVFFVRLGARKARVWEARFERSARLAVGRDILVEALWSDQMVRDPDG